MAKLFDRVKVNIATTGTGDITFGSASSDAFLTPAEAGVVDGDVVRYVIVDGTDFEEGTGVVADTVATMSRTVTRSKIGGVVGTSKINLSGTAVLALTASAADIITPDMESEIGAALRTATDAAAARAVLEIQPGMSNTERQNFLLTTAYQSKSFAEYRRLVNLFATGFKGANDTANGINTGSSSNYAVNSASGYVYPSVQKVVFITSGTTWTVPSDFTSVNKIEVIGGGGMAGANGRGGGGGGAYARIDNAALTPGASVAIQVGAPGYWASENGTTATATWMRIDGGSTAPTTTTQGVLAQPGQDGGNPNGGVGGSATTSVGTVKNKGGDGAAAASSSIGGGGGGAGGPDAAGGNATSTTQGGPGNGGLNGGGAGGTTGVNGSPGTTWTATAGGTAGPGGGGGGVASGSGKAGGAYGGGSGGDGGGTSTKPPPGAGIIVVSYDVSAEMTLVTVNQTTDAPVSHARALIEFDNTATPALNTDLTVEVTCDGGTNWTPATLSTVTAYGQGGRSVAETADAACTAGTSFAARIKTLNSKNVPIYGLSLAVH